MSKTVLLLGGLIMALVASIGIFARIALSPDAKKSLGSVIPKELPETGTNTFPREVPSDVPLTKKELLKILEASISAVNKKVDAITQRQPVSALSTATPAPTSTTTTTSAPKTYYIPIGNGGSVASQTETAVTGHEVTIDAGNYAGYKQMVLEANFRIFQGQGTAEVKLFNKTDGTTILNSSVSTTSEDYVTKTSSGFTLPSSSKVYVIQAKSSTAYFVDLQWTRVRVDF